LCISGSLATGNGLLLDIFVLMLITIFRKERREYRVIAPSIYVAEVEFAYGSQFEHKLAERLSPLLPQSEAELERIELMRIKAGVRGVKMLFHQPASNQDCSQTHQWQSYEQEPPLGPVPAINDGIFK
jgi:hypothetical protein